MATAQIVACITQRESAQKVITMGARLAREKQAQLAVVYIFRTLSNKKSANTGAQAIESIFQMAKSSGAEFTAIHNTDTVAAIYNYIRKYDVISVILDTPADAKGENRLAKELRHRIKNVSIMIL